MAARFWVGGAGTWNASNTTNWSATSGGAAGASAPTSADTVTFDALSGSGIVTTAAGAAAFSLTYNSATLTSLTLGADLDLGGGNFSFGMGSIDLNNFKLWCYGCSSTSTNTRSIAFGASGAINYEAGFNFNGTNFSYTGTSSICLTGATLGTNIYTNTGFTESNALNHKVLASYNPASTIGEIISGSVFKDFTFESGFTGSVFSFASATLTLYGSVTLASSMSGSGSPTGTWTLAATSGTQTITSAGKTLGSITVNGIGGTVTLGDALNIVGGRTLTVTNGTFTTSASNYSMTIGALNSNNSNIRTIQLNASTVTLSNSSALTFTNSTNLTFNAGTSQINLSASDSLIIGGSQTFYNVSFTNTSGSSRRIFGSNIFNNLSVASLTSIISNGVLELSFEGDQTINDTFTCAGVSAINRVLISSIVGFSGLSPGTTRTITANTVTFSDCDFRDITLAGTAAGVSPTRAGDCGNNSGIIFPAAKTVYWNLAGIQAWNNTGWATSPTGTPDANNFPLAQDTATFTDSGLVETINTGVNYNRGTINASGRTSAMTLNFSFPSLIYGSIILGSGVTISGTGSQSFCGRGTQTFTSAGKTITFGVIVYKPDGAFELGDALTSSDGISLVGGTFDAKNYNLSCLGFDSNNSNPRTLTMGSGLWTLSGTGTVWNTSTVTGLTFNKDTANILLSNISNTNRTFTSGVLTFNKLTIGGATGTSQLSINNQTTFSELASTKTVGHSILLPVAGLKMDTWSVSGNAFPVSGFQNILSNSAFSTSSADVDGYRMNYLVAPDSSFSETTPTYIANTNAFISGTNIIMLVFRPDTTPSSVTVNSLNNYADKGTLTTPANQTITSGLGTAPLVALALYEQVGGGSITTRTFSPAQDGEVNSGTSRYIKYKIYNSAPANITVGMTSTTGTARGLASYYLQFNGTSSVSFVASSTTGVAPTVQAGDVVVSFIVTGDSNSSIPIIVPVSPTNSVVVNSSAAGTARLMSLTNKTENVDYLSIRDISLNIDSSNTYIFYAGANSTNVLNNQNIAFIDRSTNNRQVAQLLSSANTSWTTPIYWNNSNNKIYMMAGGGGGGNNSVSGTSRAAAGGGGGGGFGVITNFNSSPGTVISCSIASTSATPNIDGGNTSWASTYTVVGGKRGNAAGVAQSSTGGAGGGYSPTSNPEFVGFTGGTGGAGAFGTAASTGYGGGGGGGAAGLFGNGANGGNGFGSSTAANIAGGGGGGNGGGSNGGNASAAVGGTGGNGWLGTGGPGGAGDTLQNTGAGAAGSTGSTPARPAKGIDLLNTIGGAGGYGGKQTDAVGAATAASYSYGFGGGGGGMSTTGSSSTGMNGGPGFIFIVYTEIDLPNFGYRISNTGTLFVQQTSKFDEITQTKIGVANTVFYAEEFDEVTNPGIPLRMLNTGVVQTQGIIDEITGIF